MGCLVLSRKPGEDLIVDGKTVVRIVEIRGDKVKVALIAPPEVTLHRREVWEAIHGPFDRADEIPPLSDDVRERMAERDARRVEFVHERANVRTSVVPPCASATAEGRWRR